MAVVAAALLAPLMVAQPAGAGPAIVGTAGDLAVAATTTINDYSVTMPRASGSEITADFLGLGYEQRAVIEGDAQATNLNIYDSDAKGGAVCCRSTSHRPPERVRGSRTG